MHSYIKNAVDLSTLVKLEWMMFILTVLCCYRRYQRGNRSLAANLSHGVKASQMSVIQVDMEDEDDYDVPDQIEEILGK